MRTLTAFRNIAAEDRGACVAIGNFDGVHLGHQAVIGLARAAATTRGAPHGVVTFEPHPRRYFAPDAPPFRLMNARTRAARLAKLGLDRLYELPFGDIAPLSPDDFARLVLHDGLGVRHVVVGGDFRFGRDRAGDAPMLAAAARRLGFEVEIAPLLETGGVEVSSTRIREALTAGRPEEARRMLGHLHRIAGPVLHGEKRGRTLGYPTANLSIADLHPPRFGVYAVRVGLEGAPGPEWNGVASIGLRPMFDGKVPNLEVHIFDFDGDLYGQQLSVGLVAYLRPELRFDGLDALIAAMDDDSRRARAILAR